ncbi:hypothetical protein FKR81_22120 [Lentzea tibetensis]|uniref:Uncharacterized protein n=1 Tax=Lentzea tibetensis TaxID=2591470 RepID=A0A563ER09_9PSEU|nr:hypothetical protein [Lentzea tibetensis]TWP49935.1 hypothetical protein FKR81_22120 [Lentzea tibetensis]
MDRLVPVIKLYPQLDSLPWSGLPTLEFTDREHGRTERRTVAVAPLGDHLGYPLPGPRLSPRGARVLC